MGNLTLRSPAVSPGLGEVDFDVHGLAGIRLIGASPADAASVRRQLGPLEGALHRDPDIVIRFVDRLKTSSCVRFLGLHEAGFTDDAFLILRSKHKSSAKVAVDFTEIGGQTRIVCERGLRAVPLLIPILNLSLLARGVLPLHASAFVHEGTGVVATGWSKGGKTEALLAFAARGAQYVGDEWVYVSRDGTHVSGIPEPIRIWHWQLDQLPEYAALISKREHARLRAIELLQRRDGALRRAGGGRLAALLERGASGECPENTLVAFRRAIELGSDMLECDVQCSRDGTLVVLHDITELRRLERVKTEFVANVSHELRTPLTCIRGYLETLLDGALQEPANARSFLEVATTHAERLGRLIDDLLQLSNIETGKVVLVPVKLELHGVAAGAAAWPTGDQECRGQIGAIEANPKKISSQMIVASEPENLACSRRTRMSNVLRPENL